VSTVKTKAEQRCDKLTKIEKRIDEKEREREREKKRERERE
jgi:hypothetical protein